MNEVRILRDTVKVLAGLLTEADQMAQGLDMEVKRLYNLQMTYSRRTSDAYNILKNSDTTRLNKETREKLLKLLDCEGGI